MAVTPHSSMIAFLITVSGTISLCLFVHQMLQNLERQMDFAGIRGFKAPNWLLLMLAIPFIIWMAILCVIAFAAARIDIPAKSEKEVERRLSAHKCATSVLPLFIILTYMTLMFWIILLAVFGLLVAVNFTPLRPELCNNLITVTNCYNLPHREQINTPFVRMALELSHNDQYSEPEGLLCGGELASLCTMKVSDWYNSVLAFSSCLFVVVGLIHFLMCMVANQTAVNLNRKDEENVQQSILRS